MQGAWKVGLLVVVFGALMLGAYSFLGRALFAEKTTSYFVVFDDATGLAKGGAVLVAGVKVGTIESIELTEDGLARVKLAILEGKQIPDGTTAGIQSQLIGFGDVPLILTPPPGRAASFIEPGATIRGSRSSALAGLFPEFQETASELNKTLIAARELIGDEKIKANLTQLIETASQTAEKFGTLATDLQGVLSDNRLAINDAMKSLASTMRDVQEGAKLATNLLKDDRWKKEAEGLLASLNQTASKAQEVMANVNDLVSDPRLRDSLNGTMANIQSMTESGTRIAQSTEEITKNGVGISKNVEEVTRKASELADEAKVVLQKLQDFFQKVPSTSGLKSLTTEMDLTRQSSPPHYRTDFTATYPTADGRIIAGVYDAFEANKITLQYGRDATKNVGYRYGVYASKPGVGVDFRLAARWNLRGDLYDLNDPTLDLRSRFDLGNGWLGWIGLDRVFDHNGLSIGLGIRR